MSTIHKIDATNKSLGRVATEAASVLMGKDKAAFARNIVPSVKVAISNCSKAKITEKKLHDKMYVAYSGYPGGKRDYNLSEMVTKKGYGEAFRKAIYGMLPKNKLRSVMIKNLTVEE